MQFAQTSVLECKTMKAKLGIAPIAWWNDDLAELSDDVSLEECLRQASVAGFTGGEVIDNDDFWSVPCDILIPAALACCMPSSTVGRSPPRAILRNATASRVSRETLMRRMPASSNSGSFLASSWPLVVRLMSSRPILPTAVMNDSSLGLTSGSPPVMRRRSMPAASIRYSTPRAMASADSSSCAATSRLPLGTQ